MAAKRITFPIIKVNGFTVRRNAETGVEIHNDGVDGWTVFVPARNGRDRVECLSTLAEAREWATERVEMMREVIAEAWDEAYAVVAATPVYAPGVTSADLAEHRELLRDTAIERGMPVPAAATASATEPEPAEVEWAHGLKLDVSRSTTIPAKWLDLGLTFETNWRAEPSHTPGGRLMVQVFASYNDPERGFTTVAPVLWLDELRTVDGARIV